MFDALQNRFEKVFKSLRVQGVLTEDVVDESLREVRLGLLEADVNLNVVKALLERVRAKALGEEIRSSLSPAQEVVRIVRDELIEILGREASLLTFSKEYPTVFLMVGLQGSGKTTSSGKLALWLASRKRRPMLVSTDVYRPAAREQLAVIAKAVNVPCFAGQGLNSPIELALAARTRRGGPWARYPDRGYGRTPAHRRRNDAGSQRSCAPAFVPAKCCSSPMRWSGRTRCAVPRTSTSGWEPRA